MEGKVFSKAQDCNKAGGQKNRKIAKFATMFFVVAFLCLIFMFQTAFAASTYTLSNNYFNIQIGQYGDIYSLKLVNDAFPTNYVMNAASAANQNTPDHEWMGELMFKYRLADADGNFAGDYTSALTNQSGDVRLISQNSSGVTVNYANSAAAQGIKNFNLTEKYSLVNDAFVWSITVTNTSTQKLELGDFGLPLPFNEYWTVPGNTEIYETQVMHHSYVSNDGSYIYATRPSGIGNMLLMTPDQNTGAGFEYMDHWRVQEHPGTTWAQDQGGWANGLNVYYIKSNVIKSTNRGYLPNTSLVLEPGQSKTYTFDFYNVANQAAMQKKLYDAQNIDVVSIPGMIFSTDMTAKVDLHTSQTIDSLDLPAGATMVPDQAAPVVIDPNDGSKHNIYDVTLSTLGTNNVTVHYGSGKVTTLQFYAIEPVGAAIQRHATFMVNNQQVNDATKYYNKLFDDWCMDAKMKRTDYQSAGNNAAGWGDDWGWTHGEFLAEKEVYLPVPSEISAVDQYLETAIWNGVMQSNHTDYRVNDWYIKPGASGSNMTRSFAYAHAWNTYFSMYKVEKLHPTAVTYLNDRKTYLLRAYNIFMAGQGLAMSTGLMGEQTDMDIVQALKDEGLNTEAGKAQTLLQTKYTNFMKSKYPFGSEYNFDNTGEESVYVLSRANNNIPFMQLINNKTRACRGSQPLWYFYADPTTICGEAWWNFQYSVALIDIAMNDWILDGHSAAPEVDERMSYAGKLANLVLINSGQIDSDPANVGAIAWTYQSEKGNLYQTGGYEPGNAKLHNGFREMSGEADLGIWGAMRVLSSDVAVDPIFGLYGYGCSVTDDGTSYTVVPKDGINERLNLITQKMSMTLEQDQYTQATVDYTNKNYVHFTLKNLDMTMHNTNITLTGLAAGTYDIIINHTKLGSFNQVAGKTSTAILRLDAVANSDIEIKPGEPLTNLAPVVDAGTDSTVTLPNTITLNGSASDDTYPNGTLATTWSGQTTAAGAVITIASPNALGTSVTVSAPGTYVFTLAASDGVLQSTDTVTVTVNAAPPIPEVIANYLFNETSGRAASDSSGAGNNATLFSTGTTFAAPTDSAFAGSSYVPGSNGNVVKLDGSTGYVTLPANIVKNVTDFTISTWVDVKTLGNFSRLFDFGTGTSQYMFFAPTNGGNSIFAISTTGNGAEQQLTGPVLTAGKWHHVAITHQGNVGKLYIDGSLASTNNNMTLSPLSLGATANNWIGRSQFSDPVLNGQVDNFQIYSRALSSDEVLVQAGLQPATSITSVVNPATVLVAQGVVPVPALPATVNAVWNNGTISPVAVVWEAVNPSLYSAEGSFTVNGTVLGVTTGPSAVVKVSPINSITNPGDVSTPAGTAPVLPATVRATLKSGDALNVPITWAVVDPASYASKGTFQVVGSVPGTAATAQVNVNVTASIASIVNPSDVVTPAGASPALLFPTKVTVIYTDNSTTMVGVTWSTVAASTYAIQKSTPVTVTGTVSGTTLKPSIIFTVGPAVPLTLNDVYATTKVNVQPVLQTEFDAVYTDGSIGSASVTWDIINPADLSAVNRTFDVTGHVDGSTATVTAHVTVTAEDSGIAPLAPVLVSTIESVAPTMPATVTITYTDGSTKQLAVTWPGLTLLQYNTVGTFTVQGTVYGALAGNNNPITVYAIVTVTPATLSSIAPIYQPTTLGVAPVLPSTVNGTYSNGIVKATTVTWALDPTKYNLPSYTVTGTVAGSSVKATANVGIPVQGLALWYKMNENGGTTLYDSSFNNSNGTINNTTTWTSGVNNGTDTADKGITPANNYVTVPSNPGLQSSSFTFSVWMMRTGTVSTEATVFWNKASANYAAAQGWYITFNSGLIVMLNGTTSITVPNSTPATLLANTNTWYNIVVTWNNTTKTGNVYRNGVLYYTVNVPAANVTANTGSKWFGFNSPGYGGAYLNHMNLDDLRIYSSALDQAGVTALYTNTPAITSISPVTATTTVGVPPTLPTTATAIYSDGSSKQFAVTWDLSTLDLTKTGTTSVTGTGTVDSTTKTAIATVTVTSGYPVTITASPLVRAGGYITAAYTAAPTAGVTYNGTAYLIVEVDNGSEPVSISSTKMDPASTLNRVDKFYVGSANAGYSVKVYVTDVDATNPNLIPKIKGDQVVIR
jgi:hypothetical protein